MKDAGATARRCCRSGPPLPDRLKSWTSGWPTSNPLHPKGQAGIELGLERVARVKAELASGRPSTARSSLSAAPTARARPAPTLNTSCLTIRLPRRLFHLAASAGLHNERVRLDRQPSTMPPLCAAFARVEAARVAAGNVALTYFEFGTLAAWEVFAAANIDVAIPKSDSVAGLTR